MVCAINCGHGISFFAYMCLARSSNDHSNSSFAMDVINQLNIVTLMLQKEQCCWVLSGSSNKLVNGIHGWGEDALKVGQNQNPHWSIVLLHELCCCCPIP